MKMIIAISVLLLGGGYWFYQQVPVSEDDIYVDRLVYLKKDSSLFTGTLKVSDKASYYYENFCKGIPCGEWAEHQNGGSYVARGKYLDVKETLSENTLQILSGDTVVIDYRQEGGDLPTDPRHLTVLILRDDSFFKSDMKVHDAHINKLAQSVMNDTQDLKYSYLSISFGNALHEGDLHYYKEYELKDGNLVEIKRE